MAETRRRYAAHAANTSTTEATERRRRFMLDPVTLKRLANRLSSAMAVCDDALVPLLERMPTGGWIGKGRAVILAFRNELTAVRNELALSMADPEDTPVRSPSGLMQAVQTGASGVRGIAERTRQMLDEGKK